MAWVWTDDLAQLLSADDVEGSATLQRWITCPVAIRVEDAGEAVDLDLVLSRLRAQDAAAVGSLLAAEMIV